MGVNSNYLRLRSDIDDSFTFTLQNNYGFKKIHIIETRKDIVLHYGSVSFIFECLQGDNEFPNISGYPQSISGNGVIHAVIMETGPACKQITIPVHFAIAKATTTNTVSE